MGLMPPDTRTLEMKALNHVLDVVLSLQLHYGVLILSVF